jgi:hypothetical protein
MPVNSSATKLGWERNRWTRRARRRLLVLLRQLVHAEDGDDVLEVPVALEDALHTAGDAVVLPRRRCGGRGFGCGVEGVHGGVDAQLHDLAREHGGGVEVGEGVRGAGSVRSSAGT